MSSNTVAFCHNSDFTPATNRHASQFIAKGGGSANKTYLFQETKVIEPALNISNLTHQALLNEKSLTNFLNDKLKTLGTSGSSHIYCHFP